MVKFLNCRDDIEIRNENFVAETIRISLILMIKFIHYQNDLVFKTSADFWIVFFETLLKSKSNLIYIKQKFVLILDDNQYLLSLLDQKLLIDLYSAIICRMVKPCEVTLFFKID